MKILYVTALPVPLQEVLEGRDQVSALPGFYYPMRMLAEKGHQVDVATFSNRDIAWNIREKWIRRENIRVLVRYSGAGEGSRVKVLAGKVVAYMRFLWRLHRLLSMERYDFVYCKATEALAGQWVANLHHVPVGVRWFGDLISDDILKYGVWGAALRRPVDFLGFRSRAKFLLITDDNPTKGHRYRAWVPKRNPYELLIWRSGIEFRSRDELAGAVPIPAEPFLFQAARFDRWKRQDRAVMILHEMHQLGSRVHLYLAGDVTDAAFQQEVRSLVEDLRLTEYVHFLGPLGNDDVRRLAAEAVAVPFMCDKTLNMGNLFFEVFSMGAIVVALNDGSLDEFIENGSNGLVVQDETEAAEALVALSLDPSRVAGMRQRAIRASRDKILSAEDRFGREVALIERFDNRALPNSHTTE